MPLVSLYMPFCVDFVVVVCFLTLFARLNITPKMYTLVTSNYISLYMVEKAILYMVDDTIVPSKFKLYPDDIFAVYLPA